MNSFVISYGLYVDNISALENIVYTFCRQLVNASNSNVPTEVGKHIFMPKYKQLILDRYSDTAS